MSTLYAETTPASAPVSDAAVDELQQYRRVSLAAMASVGLGVVGLFAFISTGMLVFPLIGLLCAIVAIVTGHMARAETRRAPDRLDGDALAIVGLVLGWGAVIVSVLAVMAFLMFFGGLAVVAVFTAVDP